MSRPLRGLTWDHSRGWLPLVAASEALTDRTQGELQVTWDRRSLWAFGEGSLDELVPNFDLLVVDHPFIGDLASKDLILPLGSVMDFDHLTTRERDGVGPSFRSYELEGNQWALPIDAAHQVCAARPDLLHKYGLELPGTFADVIEVAQTGLVRVPLAPVDALSCWLTFCHQLGAPALLPDVLVAYPEAGQAALDMLQQLANAVGAPCLDQNPIALLRHMSSEDDVALVPYVYGYSSYSRQGFAAKALDFHPSPTINASTSGTILGGAGLAISSHTNRTAEAAAVALWLTSTECQSSVYVECGGQPASASAWEGARANQMTREFFARTRFSIENAYVRPNAVGTPSFQRAAGELLNQAIRERAAPRGTYETLDRMWRLRRAND